MQRQFVSKYMTKSKKTFQVEAALDELSKIANAMENNQLSLDESLKNYEKAVKISQECQQALTKAEQKVQILIDQQGQSTLTDFNDPDKS